MEHRWHEWWKQQDHLFYEVDGKSLEMKRLHFARSVRDINRTRFLVLGLLAEKSGLRQDWLRLP